MKMSKFRVVLVISFLLAFTTTFVHAKHPEMVTEVNGNELRVVTDVNGNELRSGARYYMEVRFFPDLMSSAVSDASNGSCPSGNVILSDLRKRLPTSITPVKSNSTVILEDSYVTVRFICRFVLPISLVWKVGPGDRVTTGGVEGLNRFKITKYEGENNSNRYQLHACPVSECLHGCRCDPVGDVEEDKVRYLVAGREPLPIVFVPVMEPNISDKLSSM